ncbi:MAG: hypothetical protein D6760_02740 [Deltaproteobacteria bacterium]|nr:MAG: hypothetical protein D6760_02740 [Deltaproteobacteria bacterium]
MSAERLHFVVGKGGVGKSTVSAALALACARRGKRVLAVELGGPGGLARLFGKVADAPGEFVRVEHRLSIGYVDGQSALAEYLELIIPIRRLLATVFSSRIYKNFVAAAPGLKELMTIGKIWYEFHRTHDDGRPVWDVIVVDAGASGHSLQYLHMPAAAARTFRSGLVHRESERVAALLGDPGTTRIHVVALAEDMPLTEARQILERLDGDLRLPVGGVIVNRWRGEPPSGVEQALARLDECCEEQLKYEGRGQKSASEARRARGETSRSIQNVEGQVVDAGREGTASSCGRPQAAVDRGHAEEGAADELRIGAGVATAARRELAWAELQRRCLDRFRRRTGVEPLLLPLLVTEEFGIGEVERLARELAPLVQRTVR